MAVEASWTANLSLIPSGSDVNIHTNGLCDLGAGDFKISGQGQVKQGQQKEDM